MIQFRPLLFMTVFSLLGLLGLLAAGYWQWERYATKLAAAGEPVPEITIVSHHPVLDGVQFVFGVRQDTKEQGWRVFAPVQDGEAIVFVDADFIPGQQAPKPDEVRFPASLGSDAPITGAAIRPRPPGPMTAGPRPLQRLWFAIDLPAMGRNAGLDNVADYYLAATYVGADGRATPNPFALAPGADTLPPARHLGYALTWWGLALVLIVIYFAYHRSVGRFSFHAPRPRED